MMNLRSSLPLLVLLVFAVTFPFFGEKYYVDLVMKIMILSVFALSLELLVGQTGLVSFGHAAFFGIGAYAAALLSPQSGPASFWILFPAALLAAGLYALAVGALSLRTRGIYFIMVTLAFAQMAYYVFHDTKFGGGSDGIYLYFRPEIAIGGVRLLDLGEPRAFYFFVLAALVLTFLLLAAAQASRFGRALAGIKANEQRMRAAGFATYPYKLAAFVVAAMLAGVAGFLYALKDGYVNPEILSWHQSGAVLLMIILGGIGSLRGAVFGAIAFVALQEFYQSQAIFGSFAKHWQLPLGLTIIAFVALMPKGLIGLGAQLQMRKAT
ncbi:MAG: branched-chain amino acid ABC transporter permease [Burkholderiaceae bacterium]|nr:branched-chain amino acid ABC transporter permease [Burkholderiaceae bacterium]